MTLGESAVVGVVGVVMGLDVGAVAFEGVADDDVKQTLETRWDNPALGVFTGLASAVVALDLGLK